MSKTISKKAAEELFASLHDQLVNVQQTIIRIIETRAWEKLGYESFADAWKSRLADIPLATQALKAHVVYTLLETETPAWIGENVRGVTPTAAREMKRQKNAGVPPELATHRVRQYERRNPSPPSTLHISVSTYEYQSWVATAERKGENLADYCAEVLRKHFSRLA
jgi:hypothetical protein